MEALLALCGRSRTAAKKRVGAVSPFPQRTTPRPAPSLRFMRFIMDRRNTLTYAGLTAPSPSPAVAADVGTRRHEYVSCPVGWRRLFIFSGSRNQRDNGRQPNLCAAMLHSGAWQLASRAVQGAGCQLPGCSGLVTHPAGPGTRTLLPLQWLQEYPFPSHGPTARASSYVDWTGGREQTAPPSVEEVVRVLRERGLHGGPCAAFRAVDEVASQTAQA